MLTTLSDKIQVLFHQFRQEELGNRLSQFALAGLLNAILGALSEEEKKLQEKEK